MDKFEITLVKSKIKSKPYCKVDGIYSGPTWKNDIGLHSVPYNIEALHQMCLTLSERPDMCMVYGHAIKGQIVNTDRTMANFTEEPTYVLTLDLDNYEGGLKDEFPTYPDAVSESDNFIATYLPPEFQAVSYILRFSSSFLMRDTRFKAHLIFLLQDSQYPREIGTWLKKEGIAADPTFYFNLTQPIFTAGPVFNDTVDPLKKIDGYFPRVSLVRKEQDLVPKGWQPYSVPSKKRGDVSKLPHADELPGRIGSFCRMMDIRDALTELGYAEQEDGRFLAPTSQSGLPGTIVFDNGYCFTHHSDDPISQIADGIYQSKRESFNAYDLMYGWAKLNKEKNPDLITNFDYLMAEAIASDQAFQDEMLSEFVFRTEWLKEDGYTGDNKVIVDALLKDLSRSGLNEMSRSYLFDTVAVKTNKKIKPSDLKKAWKLLKKDSAFYKDSYDPEASLRNMANIFISKDILYSHHGGLRGDFWCYYKDTRTWRRLNRDQTDGYIYRHLHAALPIRKEIELHKVEALTRLILRMTCESRGKFIPGKGWAFKGGKVGVLMHNLFEGSWKMEKNLVTLQKEHKIWRQLPITYDQWKAAPKMPAMFNDFLLASFEEDYEKMDLMQEFIGYVFADSYFLHNFMVLEGVPGSGKSILVKIIRACLGAGGMVALSLSRIGTQFGLGELSGAKLVVISEAREIQFQMLRASVPVILKLTGGDPIDVEAKHKMAKTEILDAKLLIITNRTPVMPDDTGALAQRMIMMNLDKSFRGTDEEILGLDDKILKNEIPSIIKWAMTGLERLAERKKFEIAESIRADSAHYTDQLDPLKIFVRDHFRYELNPEDRSRWIKGSEFTRYFQAHLESIGQSTKLSFVQKRVTDSALRGIDKVIKRKMVRNGSATIRVVEPLVPNKRLDMYFAEELSTIKEAGMDK